MLTTTFLATTRKEKHEIFQFYQDRHFHSLFSDVCSDDDRSLETGLK